MTFEKEASNKQAIKKPSGKKQALADYVRNKPGKLLSADKEMNKQRANVDECE